MTKNPRKQIRDWVEETKRKKYKRKKDRPPTTQEKLQAILNTPKGQQTLDESPVDEVRPDGSHKNRKKAKYRKSVSFSIPKQEWKEKKKKGGDK